MSPEWCFNLPTFVLGRSDCQGKLPGSVSASTKRFERIRTKKCFSKTVTFSQNVRGRRTAGVRSHFVFKTGLAHLPFCGSCRGFLSCLSHARRRCSVDGRRRRIQRQMRQSVFLANLRSGCRMRLVRRSNVSRTQEATMRSRNSLLFGSKMCGGGIRRLGIA